MKDHDDTSQQARTVRQQATYVSPRLVVYGSLADITGAVGASSNMDGGSVAGKMMSQK